MYGDNLNISVGVHGHWSHGSSDPAAWPHFRGWLAPSNVMVRSICFDNGKQWQIQDFPLGGANRPPTHMYFLAKMYAKMKELHPIGGGGGMHTSGTPGSANGKLCR